MVEGTPFAWAVAIVSLAVGILGTVIKFVVPGRRLKESGLPTWTMVLAVAVSIVGLFVIRRWALRSGSWPPSTSLRGCAWGGASMAGDQDRSGAVAASIGIELAVGIVVAASGSGR